MLYKVECLHKAIRSIHRDLAAASGVGALALEEVRAGVQFAAYRQGAVFCGHTYRMLG